MTVEELNNHLEELNLRKKVIEEEIQFLEESSAPQALGMIRRAQGRLEQTLESINATMTRLKTLEK